ncbi:hypothetical protein [Deinococcus hopiensis]|uniref:hypothetical protein n=1 Tax=Deinococcus hopiensis TaxID=309885 RepID=UPI000A05B647|nr:hypothetical protein [Deinococcus hopiensis]
MTEGQALLASLLRHEAKTNSYKFALIRTLNDLALSDSRPSIGTTALGGYVPERVVSNAEYEAQLDTTAEWRAYHRCVLPAVRRRPHPLPLLYAQVPGESD